MSQTSQALSRFYSFGPFCLDARRLLLYKDGQVIPLAPRFVRALMLLVVNRGIDLDKNYLMDQLWPNTSVEENNLTVIISALRKAFGDDPGQHRYIVTIPGRGYRFVAEVSESSSEPFAPTGVSADGMGAATALKPALPTWSKPGISRKPIVWLGIATVLMASLIAVLVVRAWRTAKANTVHTMAVLPFESGGPGSDEEYLGLGMADGLTARLRNMKNISVRPVGDVVTSQNSAYDPRATGRTLNVSVLLTGTVEKSHERIKVSSKLLRVADGGVLWSQDFNGEIKDLLALQDRIAERVAYELTLSSNAYQKRVVVGGQTQDPEAYRLYLLGEYFLEHRSRARAQDDLNRAIAYLQQAIEKDPRFGLAYAALASAYNKLSWYVPAEDSFAKAEAAAEKALSIDDQSAEAHRSLAIAKQAYQWDFAGADAAFRRAIELDPQDSATHRWYADALLAMGRNSEAEIEWQKAQQLDPYYSLYDTLGHIYFYSRRYKQAFLELQGKQDVDPDAFWYVAWIYNFRRDDLGSPPAQFSAPTFNKDSKADLCELGYAAAVAGNRKGVEACVKSVKTAANTPYLSPYNAALLFAALNDKDSAFHWLDRARQAHTWNLMYVRVDPRIDSLRSDPRFESLLSSMGLKR